MSGFASIVGFMFSFFFISMIFFASFYSYNDQLVEQSKIFDDQSSNLNSIYSSENFNFISPFYSSGRLNYNLKNLGQDKLFFLDQTNNICFDFYYNNKYISKDNLNINILNSLFADYNYIDIGSTGVVSFITSLNLSSTSKLKTISCSGQENTFILNSSNIDWWDENWTSRKIFNVKNPASTSISEYQIELNLNSSNFDYSNFKENEVRFVLPLKENLALDLPFDNLAQTQLEYSKKSLVSVLGSTSAIEASDPSFDSNSVLFSGFDFDGVDDLITITSDNSLLLTDQLTISSWVKWNGSGNSLQNIFTNGAWFNALRIVNDGSSNQDKLLFQLSINGTMTYLYSNVTIDNNWHFISAVYNGAKMELFIDSIPAGNVTVSGLVDTNSGDNYIGSEGSDYYFNGGLDEFKFFNIALKPNEIKDLYYNNLRFRELDYYIYDWDVINDKVGIFVKIPEIIFNSNISFQMYYDNRNEKISNSNIESTFSYNSLKTLGYVLHDNVVSSTGLNIFSLYDSNEIQIGDDYFSLNERQGTTLSAANISSGDKVKMKYLSQVEGNGQADDIITPISWAGQNFLYKGFRSSNDKFCMIAPWGDAWVEFYDAGTLVFNDTVTSSVYCKIQNIGTNNVLRISSDKPILVSYAGSSEDAFAFIPATKDDLYGVPSQSLYVASGSLGASAIVYKSSGIVTSYALGSYGSISIGGNGGDGNSPAFRISSDNYLSAIQQADGDGTESTTFAPLKEHGVKFGSNEGTDYIVMASKYSDANCSIYDSTGTLFGNVVTGTGSSSVGVYFYGFGQGNDNLYVGAKWELECDKPVWPYYENHADNDDETNLFGHLQMKQYIYPEPIVVMN